MGTQGWLIVTAGPDTGRRFPLALGQTRVGLSRDDKVVLEGPKLDHSATLTIHRGYQATLAPASWGPRASWELEGASGPEPFGDGELKLLGRVPCQLHLKGLGGAPEAWLTALSGPTWGQAYPLGRFTPDLNELLPWREAQLSPEAAREVKATRLRSVVDLERPPGAEHVGIEGDASRARLRHGDVLFLGTLRFRFELHQSGAQGGGWSSEDVAPLPKASIGRDLDLDLAGWAGGFALSSKGEAVLVASSGVRCLDPTGVERWQREGDRASEPWQPEPCDAAFTAGDDLVVLYEDGVLELWDVLNGQLLRRLRWPELDTRHAYKTLVTSPGGGPLVMTGRERGSFEGSHLIRVVGIDLEAGEILWQHGLRTGRQIPLPMIPAAGGVFLRHVDEVVPGGFRFVDSVVERCQLQTGAVETVSRPEGAPVSAIADLDAERLLVVAGGRLAFWTRPGGELDPFPADLGAETRRGPLALSPDRRWAVCGNERTLELWNLAERERYGTRSLLAQDERVLDLTFRDDGRAYVLMWPKRFRRISFEREVVVGPDEHAAATPAPEGELDSRSRDPDGPPIPEEPESFLDSVKDFLGLDE